MNAITICPVSGKQCGHTGCVTGCFMSPGSVSIGPHGWSAEVHAVMPAQYVSADEYQRVLAELDTLRDEAERLRLRIENDAIRLRGMADCASGEL